MAIVDLSSRNWPAVPDHPSIIDRRWLLTLGICGLNRFYFGGSPCIKSGEGEVLPGTPEVGGPSGAEASDRRKRNGR